MPTNKGRKFAPEPLTPDEVRALLAASAGKRPIAVRNRALIAVLWRTGLRVSEARAKEAEGTAGTARVREAATRSSNAPRGRSRSERRWSCEQTRSRYCGRARVHRWITSPDRSSTTRQPGG